MYIRTHQALRFRSYNCLFSERLPKLYTLMYIIQCIYYRCLCIRQGSLKYLQRERYAFLFNVLPKNYEKILCAQYWNIAWTGSMQYLFDTHITFTAQLLCSRSSVCQCLTFKQIFTFSVSHLLIELLIVRKEKCSSKPYQLKKFSDIWKFVLLRQWCNETASKFLMENQSLQVSLSMKTVKTQITDKFISVRELFEPVVHL